MAELEQVVGGLLGSPDVVHCHRAKAPFAAVAVEQDRGDAVRHQPGRPFQVCLDGADEQSINAVFFEDPEVTLFAFGRFVGGTQNEDIVALAKDMLRAADHFGEERVGNVEQYYPNGAALADAQLVGGGAADEPDRANGVEDPLAGGRGHDRRVVEHVRHRAEGYLRKVGDVADGDPRLGRGRSRLFGADALSARVALSPWPGIVRSHDNAAATRSCEQRSIQCISVL